MATWKMYGITLLEIINCLIVGFLIMHYILSEVYENAGIAYIGNLGGVWMGVSFMLFCSYTLIRSFVLTEKSLLLKDRITSVTFWIVFVLSVFAVFSPFVRGEI
ncbi:hypothetical protein [Evansella clarkii]|uniref:hypothetical protein n=1 Tax=Evansella clarkii TaxID=79879 RepID=UPI000B44AF90|nr:hypothetical protein [Evansella clarkii]